MTALTRPAMDRFRGGFRGVDRRFEVPYGVPGSPECGCQQPEVMRYRSPGARGTPQITSRPR